jgi:E3 ubiquitin-protein ligase TRIP12
LESIQTNFGYSHDSSQVQNLVDVMCELTPEQQRQFLLFVCGTPKLPIGGFKSLNPRMTVVRKENDDDSIPADHYLPSVMTCANYIKLPAYSSKEVLRERLMMAIAEGQSAFHLS